MNVYSSTMPSTMMQTSNVGTAFDLSRSINDDDDDDCREPKNVSFVSSPSSSSLSSTAPTTTPSNSFMQTSSPIPSCLVELEYAQAKNFRFPPGCHVVATVPQGSSGCGVVGVVVVVDDTIRTIYTNPMTGQIVYRLQYHAHVPCTPQNLAFGRDTEVWVRRRRTTAGDASTVYVAATIVASRTMFATNDSGVVPQIVYSARLVDDDEDDDDDRASHRIVHGIPSLDVIFRAPGDNDPPLPLSAPVAVKYAPSQESFHFCSIHNETPMKATKVSSSSSSQQVPTLSPVTVIMSGELESVVTKARYGINKCVDSKEGTEQHVDDKEESWLEAGAKTDANQPQQDALPEDKPDECSTTTGLEHLTEDKSLVESTMTNTPKTSKHVHETSSEETASVDATAQPSTLSYLSSPSSSSSPSASPPSPPSLNNSWATVLRRTRNRSVVVPWKMTVKKQPNLEFRIPAWMATSKLKVHFRSQQTTLERNYHCVLDLSSDTQNAMWTISIYTGSRSNNCTSSSRAVTARHKKLVDALHDMAFTYCRDMEFFDEENLMAYELACANPHIYTKFEKEHGVTFVWHHDGRTTRPMFWAAIVETGAHHREVVPMLVGPHGSGVRDILFNSKACVKVLEKPRFCIYVASKDLLSVKSCIPRAQERLQAIQSRMPQFFA